MSRSYSLDLRERVVGSMRGGLSSYAAAAHYQVSHSSAQRWFNRALAEGSPAALPVGGRRGFLLADKLDWITRRLAEAPDLTLRGLLRGLREAGVEVSYFGVWNFVHKSGLTYKKSLHASEQVFATLKTLLRRTAARTVEDTWKGIGSLLNAFTPQECTNDIRNSGYAST